MGRLGGEAVGERLAAEPDAVVSFEQGTKGAADGQVFRFDQGDARVGKRVQQLS